MPSSCTPILSLSTKRGKSVNNSEKEASPIEAKLDVVIRLLALSVAPEDMPLNARAIRLKRAGLGAKEIADLCGTTRNTVSVALSTSKKKKAAKTK